MKIEFSPFLTSSSIYGLHNLKCPILWKITSYNFPVQCLKWNLYDSVYQISCIVSRIISDLTIISVSYSWYIEIFYWIKVIALSCFLYCKGNVKNAWSKTGSVAHSYLIHRKIKTIWVSFADVKNHKRLLKSVKVVNQNVSIYKIYMINVNFIS